MLKNICISKKGFSLLEVMVVIGIIFIISAISFGFNGNGKDRANVANACEQTAAMINKAQNYVLSGKARSVTVSVGAVVEISGDVTTESFTYPGGVTCAGGPITYNAPNALPTSTANIVCQKGAGVTKNVNVNNYRATCGN